MMHDPFQTHSMWGAYPGTTGGNPLAINPLIAGISGQQIGNPGIFGYGGIHPQQLQQLQQQQQLQQLQQLQQHVQQLQLAALLASQTGGQQWGGQSPFMTGLQNPLSAIGLHNPLPYQQNPFLSQHLLQNPLLNPIVQQYYQSQQYPQIGYGSVSPFGQVGSPFGQAGYPLAPQSWIGQQGLGGASPFGQGHPLLSQLVGSPLVGRGFQGHGVSPWSAF
jgi:hypothetical protein